MMFDTIPSGQADRMITPIAISDGMGISQMKIKAITGNGTS